MMTNKEKFGTCECCGGSLVPVTFTEHEYKTVGGIQIRTGRKRCAVSHLECADCLKRYCVDDSFDGPWR